MARTGTKGHDGAGNFTDAVVVFDGVTGAVLESRRASKAPQAGPLRRGWASCDAWGNDRLVVYGGLSGNDDEPLRLEDTWVMTVTEGSY